MDKDAVRFLEKVDKQKKCWLFLGYVAKNGYGHFYSNGKTGLAHRFSYELHKGKIPEKLVVDHLCKVRSCVNPEHMEIVTLKENSLRGTTSQNNLKKTECIRGHIFSIENTYIHKTTNERVCRKCKAMHQRKYGKK